ncbi:ankyrin repeat domain-containing protein [Roseateles chitinivorans]|uniref:ankyrin repeat domain-containing protein n=1 Tax=Roseateles chitinivorans TaxID=2917965 RepID=UPI003D67F0CF
MHDKDIVTLVRAYATDPAMGDALLGQRPDLLNARTGLGETPIHLLCHGESVAAVRALLAHGPDINTLNFCGGSPLSEAALIGRESIVQMLLENGALLSIPNQDEPTLQQAIRSGNVRLVELILDAGAPVDERGPLNQTALHLAVENDRVEIAALLIARGADPSALNGFNESALEIARGHESAGCLQLLKRVH